MSNANHENDILVRGLIDCGTHGALFEPGAIETILTLAEKLRSNFAAATPDDIEFVEAHIDAILILDCYSLRVKGEVSQADKNLETWMKFFETHGIEIGTIYAQCFQAIFLNMDGRLFEAERAANCVLDAIGSIPPDRIDALIKLAAAVAQFVFCATQFELRRFEELPELLDKTQAIVDESTKNGPPRQLAICVRGGVNLYRGKLFIKKSKFTEAQHALDLAEKDYQSIRSVLGPSDVRVERARLLYQQGGFDETIEYLRTCERVYTRHNAIDRLVGTLNFIARALYKIGRDHEARSKIEECRSLWEKHRTPERWLLNKNHMLARETLGRLHLLNLALPEAEEELTQAKKLAEGMQLRQEVGYCHTWLAAVYRKTRRLDRAILFASRAKDLFLAEPLPDKAYVYADMELTLAMFLARDFEKGIVLAKECLDRAKEIKNAHMYGEVCAEIAVALCKVGKFEDAGKYIERGEEWIDNHGTRHPRKHNYLAQARVYYENLSAIDRPYTTGDEGDTDSDTYIVTKEINQASTERMQDVRDHIALTLPKSISKQGYRLQALDNLEPWVVRYVFSTLKYEYEPCTPCDDRVSGAVHALARFLEQTSGGKQNELEPVLNELKSYEQELNQRDRALKTLRRHYAYKGSDPSRRTRWLETLEIRDRLMDDYARTESPTAELRTLKDTLAKILPDDRVDSNAYGHAPMFGKLVFLSRHAGFDDGEISVILGLDETLTKKYLRGGLLWRELERHAQLLFNGLFIILGNSFRAADRDPFEIRRFWSGPIPNNKKLRSAKAKARTFKELLMNKKRTGLDELLSDCREI